MMTHEHYCSAALWKVIYYNQVYIPMYKKLLCSCTQLVNNKDCLTRIENYRAKEDLN